MTNKSFENLGNMTLQSLSILIKIAKCILSKLAKSGSEKNDVSIQNNVGLLTPSTSTKSIHGILKRLQFS